MFAAKNELLTRPSGYKISRSLRFRSSASAYLSRTPASAGNRTTYTWSGWVKRGYIGSNNLQLFGAGSTTTDIDGLVFLADAIQFYTNASSAGYASLITTQVFRDPSAWYHIMVAVDTTQATASNRVKLYVNGVQITAFSSATYPNQNTTSTINNTVRHAVGAIWYSTSYVNLFDGYLAEVNFIDGQALTPSSFGAFDTNGVWQPKAFTGTYSGNSFYLPFSATPTSSYAASFNGSSQYLVTSTNAGLGLGTSDFTVEYWMNHNAVVNGSSPVIAGPGTGTFDGLFGYTAGTAFVTYLSSTGSSWDIASNRTAIATLTAGRWYHMAYTRSGSTWRVFVDGVLADTFTSAASLYQSGNQFSIARVQSTITYNGLVSNVRVIKGTALYTSNFVPSTTPLTAVTNTQLLTLQNATIVDNSPNALTITNTGAVTTSAATPWMNFVAGQDSSGLGNGWASVNVNVTTSGTTYDSMIDSPTNYADGGNGRGNYCVLNPLNKNASSITVLDGNLGISTSAVNVGVAGTIGISSGKYYWETTFTNASGVPSIGAAPATWDKTYVGSASGGGIGYHANGAIYSNGTSVQGVPTYTTGDVISVAIDLDVGSISFYKNNVQAGTTITGLTGTWFPAIAGQTSSTLASNFGQRPFTYTPPSGFSALNTQNLPTPTIANGAQNFDINLRGGTGAPFNVTGKSVAPDFVWTKERGTADGHRLFSRGLSFIYTYIDTSSTGAEVNNSNNLTAFNTDGFSGGSGLGTTGFNDSGATYVDWMWKAGGTGVTNTSGSITSTVSANTSAGFSVVTYTGTATASTVGHGLGVAPGFIIVKSRSAVSPNGWVVYHASLGAGNTILLNSANPSGASGVWGNTSPTSSVFTLPSGTGYDNNNSGTTYVAYCYASVAGYSAFGSYTGNGSADGTFVYTGFRPRWVIIKSTTLVQPWNIFDTSRDAYNVEGQYLQPSNSGAEATFATLDVTSNGFKLRTTGAHANSSGDVLIYAAFAENPFKYSRAR